MLLHVLDHRVRHHGGGLRQAERPLVLARRQRRPARAPAAPSCASAATAAIAMATGVGDRADDDVDLVFGDEAARVVLTPLVGSVASSRMITLSFSPAIVFGQSAMLVLHRDAEAGGRAGERQADADRDVGQRRRRRPARRWRRRASGREACDVFFMACLLVVERIGEVGVTRSSARMSSGIGMARRRSGSLGVAAHEGARLAALADQRRRRACTRMRCCDEHLGAPLLDVGRDRAASSP